MVVSIVISSPVDRVDHLVWRARRQGFHRPRNIFRIDEGKLHGRILMLYLAEPSCFNASPNKGIFWARLHEFLRRYMLKSPMAMESYFGTLESPSHHLLFLILFRAHYYDRFVDSAIVLGTSQSNQYQEANFSLQINK